MKNSKSWDVNVDNVVISKLVKTKLILSISTNILISYKPLVLIMPKLGGYIKISKVNDGDLYCLSWDLNVPEDAEFESFTIIYIDYLLVSDNKYYL